MLEADSSRRRLSFVTKGIDHRETIVRGILASNNLPLLRKRVVSAVRGGGVGNCCRVSRTNICSLTNLIPQPESWRRVGRNKGRVGKWVLRIT